MPAFFGLRRVTSPSPPSLHSLRNTNAVTIPSPHCRQWHRPSVLFLPPSMRLESSGLHFIASSLFCSVVSSPRLTHVFPCFRHPDATRDCNHPLSRVLTALGPLLFPPPPHRVTRPDPADLSPLCKLRPLVFGYREGRNSASGLAVRADVYFTPRPATCDRRVAALLSSGCPWAGWLAGQDALVEVVVAFTNCRAHQPAHRLGRPLASVSLYPPFTICPASGAQSLSRSLTSPVIAELRRSGRRGEGCPAHMCSFGPRAARRSFCSAAHSIPLPAWPAGGRGSATPSVMHVGRSGLLPAHQAVAVAVALPGAAAWAQRGVRAEEPTTTMTSSPNPTHRICPLALSSPSLVALPKESRTPLTDSPVPPGP
jgi:hypothetical protein